MIIIDFDILRLGKKVIENKSDKKNYAKYVLYQDAKEEDCVFDIPDQLREAVEDSFGFDPFEGYNKIEIVLKEFDTTDLSSQLLLDFTSLSDMFKLSYSDYYLAEALFDGSFDYVNFDQYYIYFDKDGKELFRGRYVSNKGYEYEMADDVTEEDDIVLLEVDINEGTRYQLNKMGFDIGDYSKLVLKFSDKEYDETYYVVDFTDSEHYFGNLYSFWSILADHDITRNPSMIIECYNEDDAILFKLGMLESGLMEIKYLKDFEYSDNMIFDISDDEDFKERLSELGVKNIDDATNMVLMFKNPEFVDGKDQKYDVKKDKELKFRLNIPLDRFKSTGKVYLDGEVVDSKNYELTEGSTIITFKKDFVDNLKMGNHTIRATVIDGEATTAFSLVEGVEAPVTNDTIGNPDTNDNVITYILILVLGIVGITLESLYIKKRLIKNN